MGKFRDFVNETYGTDPSGAVKFVNRTVRLVKVGCHWWRGRRKMTDGVVEVSGRKVGEQVATKPSWKLLPEEVAAEFQAFERSVDELTAMACVKSVQVDGETRPLVFGAGVYAVDVAQWPALQNRLKGLQAKWDEAANRWCTEDGYRDLLNSLKAQIGETDYPHVEKLIPPPEQLRGRFWLEVMPLPFRLSEQVQGVDEERDRGTVVSDLLEAAVKGPRDEAAAEWRGLAGQLVDVNAAGVISAYRPTRKNPDGTTAPTSRRLRHESVINARRAVDGLARCARFHDPDLVTAAAAVRAETADDKITATEIARKLNAEDLEAVRVAKILLHAAAVAVDEARMCIGVAAAMSVGESPTT